MPNRHCLGCGKLCDTWTYVMGDEGVVPEPGDFTLCIFCGHVMAFTDDLGLRNVTDAEKIKIAGDRELLAAQRVRPAVKEKFFGKR